MKSICIKTNKESEINYLLNAINDIDIEKVYYSSRDFKIYHNIILHYKGFEYEEFISIISKILSNMVINVCEEDILKKLISYEYFYFDYFEKSKIMDFIYDLQNENDFDKKYNYLYNSFYSYIKNNKKIFLEGFITFRIKDYIDFIAQNIDFAVNSYLIDREYNEFISILKLYVKSQESHANIVHLVYSKSNTILLDEKKNIIEDKAFGLNAKYLSDISFSENDYTFNTILSLVPKKIYIHLVDKKCDEFINTLKLIFEKRIVICKDCNICKSYQSHRKSSSSIT